VDLGRRAPQEHRLHQLRTEAESPYRLFPLRHDRSREEDLTNLLTRLMEVAPPDAIGLWTPWVRPPEAIKYLVRKVKSSPDFRRDSHAQRLRHGVATELAAVAAGAEVVHSCVNGLANGPAMRTWKS